MPVTILNQLPDIATPRLTVPNTTISSDPSSTAIPSDVKGTIYVTDHQLLFFSTTANTGFAINYQTIIIHAISRVSPAEQQQRSHLYCQLGCRLPGTQETDGTDDYEEFSELRAYPDDEECLDRLFAVMSECAAMNPDEDDEVYSDDEEEREDDEEEEDGDPAIRAIGEFDPSGFITSVDQLDQLTPAGKAVLKHLESVIVIPEDQENGRFSDAEDVQDQDQDQTKE
ncbi:hypothetical protein H4R99_000928 [Coemansia sp. RSA 1722]|nr:hypothetical protein LPJ57_000429 [Coemansia sp. RSA 486]KAJ2237658.1 hypothetical protein IWW45_000762 [Coemansia sp. RSA 485]KAJ2600967.1 hypothetical protein GGF39_001505 [Coemansia sp. RSA 1721]KAJ2605677.1 hypothetical protein H4R99_000928 [Coemansia sp. RSA 1722]KAJ2638968.1 hypothetical protein GGF40_001225 [Coemansia sp. RSA 1286]